MTDRKLLEAAAKSAGIALLDWRESWADYPGPAWRTQGHALWNPLEDDGDALRLAAKLRLTVGDDDQSVRSMAFSYARHSDTLRCYEPSNEDPAAAYRRAIVRAAAAIADAAGAA